MYTEGSGEALHGEGTPCPHSSLSATRCPGHGLHSRLCADLPEPPRNQQGSVDTPYFHVAQSPSEIPSIITVKEKRFSTPPTPP